MSDDTKQGGQPKHKIRRNISIDPDLWHACLDKAKKNQQSVSAVICAILEDWLDGRYKPTGKG